MRIDNIQFPILDWVKNKRISSDIDFSQFSLTEGQKRDSIMVINKILTKDNFKCEFVSGPIIQVIDYNDKNIEAFSKLREDKHEGTGLFMYNVGKHPCSILYSIKNGSSDWKNLPEDITGAMKKSIITYTFIKNKLMGSFVAFFQGKDSSKDIFKYYIGLCHHHQNNTGNIYDDFHLVDDFMIFKKYAELQTKILPPKSGADFINCRYVNNTSKQVILYDSTYFTTLIKSEGFNVRGHFRLQPYGEGMKEKKLIWINDFQKNGYIREAKKLKEHES